MFKEKIWWLIGGASLFVLGFWLGRPGSSPPNPNTAVDKPSTTKSIPELWTCSMHPRVRQNEFGLCPLCGMDLVLASGDELGAWQLEMSERAQELASVQVTPVERKFVAREIRLVGKVEYDEKPRGRDFGLGRRPGRQACLSISPG